jgi:hypothetical protein
MFLGIFLFKVHLLPRNDYLEFLLSKNYHLAFRRKHTKWFVYWLYKKYKMNQSVEAISESFYAGKKRFRQK